MKHSCIQFNNTSLIVCGGGGNTTENGAVDQQKPGKKETNSCACHSARKTLNVTVFPRKLCRVPLKLR